MLEPEEAKKQFRSKTKKLADAENIVFSISREPVKDGYKYHAYNVFGKEIEGYFCDECIKAHPEQFDFSQFELTDEPNSECKDCEENKIKIKEN